MSKASALEFFHGALKQKGATDEYITPISAVEVALPFVKRFSRIWCPFDLSDSNFVSTFRGNGLEVFHSHICEGYDFFERSPSADEYDVIVSNPPFSLRNEVFVRLFEIGKPFMMLVNASGLFDNRQRFELFKKHGIELLVPHGRTKFVRASDGVSCSPMFQSFYVCHEVLPQQIVFSDI